MGHGFNSYVSHYQRVMVCMSISRESNGRPKFYWNSPLFSIACSIDAGKDITIMPASEATSIHSWGFGPHYGSNCFGSTFNLSFATKSSCKVNWGGTSRYPLALAKAEAEVHYQWERGGRFFASQTTEPLNSGSSSFQPFPSLVKPSLYHCIIGWPQIVVPHFETGYPKMIPSIATILLADSVFPCFWGKYSTFSQ